MTDHKTLSDFAEKCGVTDDARENVELNPPEDGHVLRESTIDDYWHGLTEHMNSTHPAYSFVPAGRVLIVLDPDEDVLHRGWASDDPLERGVYLDGRAEIGSEPPTPVEVDDVYLRFAAEASLLAVDNAADDDDDIVAITKENLSLSFAVRGEERGYQEYVVQTTPSPITYPRERPDDLFHGFSAVRRFGTPYEVYTHAEVPRLSLEDLDVEWSR